jgi:sugar phosphate isomerase/epimerase
VAVSIAEVERMLDRLEAFISETADPDFQAVMSDALDAASSLEQRGEVAMSLSRREFLAAAAAAVPVCGLWGADDESRRKFTIALACGPLGVRANLQESIDLAARYGFEAVEPQIGAIQRMSDSERDELPQQLQEKGLAWGTTGVPVDIRAASEAEFADQLAAFPSAAQALSVVGASRVSTWISPSHGELTYLQNFRQHADRVGRIAAIAADHGVRFGLEYVGTRHLLNAARYPFLHTLAETRELITETGRDNVGVVLDSWHWYAAEETAEDLLQLTNDEVVACDLNDAPRGLAPSEQRDNRRELPAATGVIDIGTFLDALVQIGFDGPVRCEPFNQALREAAVAATARAMKQAVALVDEGTEE